MFRTLVPSIGRTAFHNLPLHGNSIYSPLAKFVFRGIRQSLHTSVPLSNSIHAGSIARQIHQRNVYNSPPTSLFAKPVVPTIQFAKVQNTSFLSCRTFTQDSSPLLRRSLRRVRRDNRKSQWRNESTSEHITKNVKDGTITKATGTSANLGKPSRSDRKILGGLPTLSHRFHAPTKEELLAAATGFWSRLRVRFKWLTIRSGRPFNLDEIGAFFSWIVVGHLIWIVVGTTTFFSLLIYTANTVFAQETLARWVGNYLTQSSGIKVVFESAIVPKWKDGVITFKNVFVSRRPGQKSGTVTKGSPTSAAAAAAAAALNASERVEARADDGNYTQFDLSVETVNVTLSFTKWFNGKGLLKNVEVKGIRGVVDRTHVQQPDHYIDPRTYKNQHKPGDFEIESFKLEDLLISIYQPRNFQPFSVSIFSADLPQLRRHWLFYDLLSANHVSGSFDESLFTIHPRQTHNLTGSQMSEGLADEDQSHWKKQSRIRIDGLKIDHLNRGVEGPFSWIHDGNVDIVADILLPTDNDESIAQVMANFYERLEAEVSSKPAVELVDAEPISTSILDNPPSGTANVEPPAPARQQNHDNRFVIFDLRIHLNSVHASVPLFARELSYVNNALIRPIVAYINTNQQFIPVHCRVVKRASDFEGSWTMFDSGLMEDMNRNIYEAFAGDVVDEQARMRRIKKVGLWSLSLAFQALFLGLAGHIA